MSRARSGGALETAIRAMNMKTEPCSAAFSKEGLRSVL